jgi:DNA-binding helix-hairpin-helix protein with protein kinase domain
MIVKIKLTRITLALLVFLSSTFAVAPMAFCFMKAETMSCCQRSSGHTKHSDHKPTKCPICAYENNAPAPINKSDTPAPSSPQILCLTVGQAMPIALPAPTPKAEPYFLDSSPPKFVLNCTFRI